MRKRLRIGYSAWGFLGDVKMENGQEVSTPDGNATYSTSIIWEAQHVRGHQVYWMQNDRDEEAFKIHGQELFASFSKNMRKRSYREMGKTHGITLPELDVLLLEWRFPIFGRNCNSWEGAPCFPSRNGGYSMATNPNDAKEFGLQPDLARQYQLLKHYKEKGTKIIFWDLDHKLTEHEEKVFEPDAVFETSVFPRKLLIDRTRVEPPFSMREVLQFPTFHVSQDRKMVYVGSRYERDDVIDEWIKPTPSYGSGQVVFYGKWDGGPDRWPSVQFKGRITTKDFREAYSTAACCPLLAKRSYFESGFITPRPWEALLFGTLPVGFACHEGVEQYVGASCLATSPKHLGAIAEAMSYMDVKSRHRMREELAHQLSFMDAKHFMDRIEEVANGYVAVGENQIAEEGATNGKEGNGTLQAG